VNDQDEADDDTPPFFDGDRNGLAKQDGLMFAGNEWDRKGRKEISPLWFVTCWMRSFFDTT